ncbi:MAG: PEGA domain-containing protein [Quadrisphaera sp.]
MPTISIRREYGSGLLRRMKVLVDGQPVGWLRNDSTIDVEVPAGTHSVQVRMDWQRSAPVTMTLSEDQRVDLRARLDSHTATWTGMVLRPHQAIDLDVLA